jgi:integrating conjugative element protein (TIGR03749 family)
VIALAKRAATAAQVVLFGLFTVLGSLTQTTAATEIAEWRNVPISIVLNVGEERVLAFPDHVQVGLPPTLTPHVFRTQSSGGTVLWLARGAFDTERLQVRLLSTGHVMLFDVTAVEGDGAGTAEPIQVTLPEATSDSTPRGSGALVPISLTRFAAQQLYSPARLMRDVPGIRRVPMGVAESVSLYRAAELIAHPLGSWQGGGLYVTAVKLTNLGTSRVILDPRLLNGHFVSATFQHNTLGPSGSPSDTTCVYLVTDRPFAASFSGPPDQAAALESGN